MGNCLCGCHDSGSENQKVYVCFDGDGYDVVGIYTSKAEAQRHMINAYIDELRREKQLGKELDFDGLIFDLQSMFDGYIESFFYIEEHEVKTHFEVDTF
jgi:hypothetical protein